MDIYTCDPQWPVCIYDFTFKNINPKYVALRVKDHLTTFVIDDYFGGSHPKGAGAKPKDFDFDAQKLEDLLIQRNAHICQCGPTFV